MKRVKVIQSYQTQYLDPIQLSVDDFVYLGQEEVEEKWKGWIWAECKKQNKSGWIPIQIIEFSLDKKTGKILNKYSAKELTVSIDDEVEIIENLNGWTWVRNCNTKEEGWIPSEIISS
jgi:hypothetical protein